VAVVAIALALTVAPLSAQGRGKGAGSSKPPKPPASAPGNSGKPPSSKPPTAKAPPAHGANAPAGAPETKPNKSSAPPAGTSISAHLQQQPQLASKLAGLLPPGTNLATASSGFKNLGQFVAAVHVSHNLGIPFDQLHAQMTGPSPVSLGQAIQKLRPATTNINREVQRAEDEAREDMKVKKE
jgi:hypothetical protein